MTQVASPRSRQAHSTFRPARVLSASLLISCLWLAGCGVYGTTPGQLPGHIKTISIPTFENLTTQVGLDQEVTQAIVDRFVADNNLRVVDENDANAVLSGAVTRYSNAIFGFTGNVEAEQYRVTVTISVRMFDKVKNREIWKDEGLSRTSNYYVVEVAGQPAQDETTGRNRAIQKLVDEVISRTVDTW